MTSHYLRYSIYSFFRLQIRLTLGIFAVAAVFLDVAALAGFRGGNAQSPPLVFAAFFTFAVLWVTYWFGFRIAYWLEARDGQLLWRSGIRSGTVSIQAITSIGASAWLSGIGVIRTENRRIYFWPTKYFPTFANRMGQLYPGIQVKVGKLARFNARLQGAFSPASGRLSVIYEEGDD
ncbi:MAG: hypothetical protein WB805_12665 [Candidatus Dormiibacterota bacterium]